MIQIQKQVVGDLRCQVLAINAEGKPAKVESLPYKVLLVARNAKNF